MGTQTRDFHYERQNLLDERIIRDWLQQENQVLQHLTTLIRGTKTSSKCFERSTNYGCRGRMVSPKKKFKQAWLRVLKHPYDLFSAERKDWIPCCAPFLNHVVVEKRIFVSSILERLLQQLEAGTNTAFVNIAPHHRMRKIRSFPPGNTRSSCHSTMKKGSLSVYKKICWICTGRDKERT